MTQLKMDMVLVRTTASGGVEERKREEGEEGEEGEETRGEERSDM